METKDGEGSRKAIGMTREFVFLYQLQQLGRNLAAAAALCWAFELGRFDRGNWAAPDEEWYPGCGSESPQ